MILIIMVAVRTIIGSVLGAFINLLAFRLIPFTPDLTDWGGRAYPRTYLFPLLAIAVIGYIAGWAGAKISPATGRLCGIFGSIITGAAIIGWGFSGKIIEPLFHHPAYPVFSDHTLLALAILLVAGHLGGVRVEKSIASSIESDLTTPDRA